MNKYLLGALIFGVVWNGGLGRARCQTTEKSPLPDPLLIRLPDQSAAVVTARRLKALSPEELADPIRQSWSPDLQTAVLSRAGNQLVIAYTWEGGKTSHVLRAGADVFYQPSLRYPEDVQVNGAGAPDVSRTDFPWLSWALATTYRGEDVVNGKKVFRLERRALADEANRKARRAAAEAAADAQGKLQPAFREEFIRSVLAADDVEEIVWLDRETLLPVKSVQGGMEFTYTYRRGQSADLQVPEVFDRARSLPR